ncbi:helix-turn-helix domain-containing protein [Galbibacter sp.]|jgi:transcriptional regulator with XRE-family HTH domain|uniref:helix-turn-helix domain-containing protein n=1 Tax=Galbibacter sp. TaxID=2918471 RepID=UPI003A93A364
MNRYSIEKLPLDVQNDLAQKIKELRKQKKFTQVELAERSGVSLGSLKRFESKGQISLESLLRLVQILGRLSDFEDILKPEGNLSHIESLFDRTKK